MSSSRRAVADTNVLISRLLMPESAPGRAVRRIVREGTLLLSDALMGEMARVLGREKFDPYVTVVERQEFMRRLGRVAARVEVIYRVQAFRDPKDDMEVAVNGEAEVIVTGDKDLLSMGNYRGIGIVASAGFLEAGWSGVTQ